MLWAYVLLTLSFLILLLYYLNFRLMSDGNYWTKRGVTTVGLYATAWERIIRRVPVHFLDARVYRKFKAVGAPYVGFMELSTPALFVLRPEHIRNIFVKDFEHFVNRRSVQMRGDDYFNKGLVMLEGDEWKEMRATLSPTFTTSRIRGMFPIFDKSGQNLLTFLRNRDTETELEVNDPFGRYTIDVISSAAFGCDSQNFEKTDSIFAKMAWKFQEGFRGRVVYKLILILLLPWLSSIFKVSIFDRAATTFLIDCIRKSIKYRETVGEKRNDFLQLLIDTKTGRLKPEEEQSLESFEKDASLTPNQRKLSLTDDLIYAQSLL
jgi:cytochrome P450 family 9